MITTVTLSPSIDKTIVLKDFSIDRVNRASAVRLDAGGKGVNVSLALAALDIPSRAVGFNFELGGRVQKTLTDVGVDCEFIPCPGAIRTNTKIYVENTRNTVEINEQNPVVSPKNVQKLLELLKKIAKDRAGDQIFVLSGSVPPGVDSDIYKVIISTVKQESPRSKIILDADGAPLSKGVLASPYMIKPNVDELKAAFGCRIESDYDIVLAAKEIISCCGVGIVAVSKGADGAVAVTKNDTFSLPGLKIDAKSAQGAGDAMVAGACFAISKGLSTADILRFGTCAAAGAVEKEGTSFCSRERFEELLMEIRD